MHRLNIASHDATLAQLSKVPAFVTLFYAGRRAVAAIASQQCAGELINTKQLDDKFPLELVFLFARHVRSPLFPTIYVGRRQI